MYSTQVCSIHTTNTRLQHRGFSCKRIKCFLLAADQVGRVLRYKHVFSFVPDKGVSIRAVIVTSLLQERLTEAVDLLDYFITYRQFMVLLTFTSHYFKYKIIITYADLRL